MLLLGALAVAPLGAAVASALFALSAAVFWASATRECRSVLKQADYRYATAF